MNNRTKGIICIIISAFSFTTMSVFIKLAGELPTAQKVIFRNLIALFVAGVMIIRTGGRFLGEKRNQPLLICRSIAGTVGVAANYYAVDHLLLSDANMLNKMSPFFTIVFSALFLKEGFTLVHLFAFIAAFGGSLFIIKPGFGFETLPALAGFAGGAAAGIAYGFVRMLGAREKPYTIIFYFSFFSTLVVLPALIHSFTPMTGRQTLFLLLAGSMASLGQIGVTLAYKFAPSREISIFNYLDIFFSTTYGYLFFGAVPDQWSVAGYIAIAAASLALFFYNSKKSLQG
jgi:drug/metabolite transporter (DMT)-like permease